MITESVTLGYMVHFHAVAVYAICFIVQSKMTYIERTYFYCTSKNTFLASLEVTVQYNFKVGSVRSFYGILNEAAAVAAGRVVLCHMVSPPGTLTTIWMTDMCWIP